MTADAARRLGAAIVLVGCGCPAPANSTRLIDNYDRDFPCVEPASTDLGEQAPSDWTTDTDGRPIAGAVDGLTVVREGAPSSGSGAVQLPSRADVDVLASILRDLPLMDGIRPLEFAQIQNDCERRAHIVAEHILRTYPTWVVGKAFVTGRLRSGGGLISWGYHIAPYVLVAGDSGHGQVLVLDPAANNRAMTLTEWVRSAAQSSEAEITSVQLLAVNALTSNFTPDGSFCSSVRIARSGVIGNAECRGRGDRERHGMRVERIDEHRVWFEGTGWFTFVADARETLLHAHAQQQSVTIHYERVDRGGWAFGNVLNIQRVELEAAGDDD